MASLLALPLGVGSFLEHITTTLGDIADGELLVMPTFPYGREYERKIHSVTTLTVRVIPSGKLSGLLDNCEPEDYLLVVDPARWVLAGVDFAPIMCNHREYRGATHGVVIGANTESTREYVECGGNGDVRRVQRFYNRVSWPEVAAKEVLFSLVPARAVGDTRFRSLAELRGALSTKGVLSRDLPVPSDPVDVIEEAGFLALNEQTLTLALSRPQPGFSKTYDDVMLGRDCSIDESSRLVGPVIIHHGVTVKEGATIIGPTLVAAGSTVGRGSTVVNSILAPNTIVDDGVTIVHRVGCGRFSSSTATSGVRAHCSLGFEPARKQQHTDGGIEALPRGKHGYRCVRLALKRLMDVVLASAALVVLSPLLVLVALLIKLDSPGPVFFLHRRERRNGKEFSCLKFRTMVADAHRRQRELYKDNEVDGPQFKINHDPRLTRLGPRLRSTNIDELPQLINVLLGHMSLVGPRPSPFRENQICVPWRRARLSVRPGVTGLWQLCRDQQEGGDFHQWIYYDLVYVRNLSVWIDVKILLATVFTLGGRWNVSLSWFVRDGDEGGGLDPGGTALKTTEVA